MTKEKEKEELNKKLTVSDLLERWSLLSAATITKYKKQGVRVGKDVVKLPSTSPNKNIFLLSDVQEFERKTGVSSRVV